MNNFYGSRGSNNFMGAFLGQGNEMSDELPYIENENGEFAVPCQIKIAEDCAELGEFCETKEDACDWVEEECWISSGEGHFCVQCNDQVLRNIANLATKKMI
jgi:hypothetical protein